VRMERGSSTSFRAAPFVQHLLGSSTSFHHSPPPHCPRRTLHCPSAVISTARLVKYSTARCPARKVQGSFKRPLQAASPSALFKLPSTTNSQNQIYKIAGCSRLLCAKSSALCSLFLQVPSALSSCLSACLSPSLSPTRLFLLFQFIVWKIS
jgi:hypothetical protein